MDQERHVKKSFFLLCGDFYEVKISICKGLDVQQNVNVATIVIQIRNIHEYPKSFQPSTWTFNRANWPGHFIIRYPRYLAEVCHSG